MKSLRLSAFVLASITMALGLSGCSSQRDWKFADMFDLKKGMPWHDDGPEPGLPNRVVGTWTDTVLTQAGKKPQRGFGGRLLFYDNESKDPIYVDGQLVVYAFDETNREVTDNRPTRRYVFPVDQVPLHMSESELGPSYSFWLPWDEVGGPQTEVSLICRFEPKDGPLVVGEQTKHMLPGVLVAKPGRPKLPDGVPFKPGNELALYSASTQGGSHMQEASFERPIPGGTSSGEATPAERRMQTTSISLPQSFRVQGSAANVQAGPKPNAGVRAAANTYPPQQSSGGIPSTPSGAGMIPTPQYTPAPAYAPPQQNPPGSGYPGAPAAPAGQTQMQPITPVGTNALVPAVSQATASQAWPQYPQQLGDTSLQNGVSTTVTVLTPGESARRRWGQPSLGSTPGAPPAPAPPAFR